MTDGELFPGESSHKISRGLSFSHRVIIWSRSRVVGERTESGGGVTESVVLCCLSECWPVTTRGVSHVLSVAGRWVVPSETEESGCKPCQLTQQRIFIHVRVCVCVCVWLCGVGGVYVCVLIWEHCGDREMCKVRQRWDGVQSSEAGSLAAALTCCWLQVR